MSAFGGKADLIHYGSEGPLIATSGHSTCDAQQFAHSHFRTLKRSVLTVLSWTLKRSLLLSEQLSEPLHRTAKFVPIAIAEGLFRFC